MAARIEGHASRVEGRIEGGAGVAAHAIIAGLSALGGARHLSNRCRNLSLWCGVHHQPRNLNPEPNALNPKPQSEARFLGPAQPQP